MKMHHAVALFAWVVSSCSAAGPVFKAQSSGSTARLRGVSAVSTKVAWASGNQGTVLRTENGGQAWTKVSVPGAESLDFRDIEAFDADTAYVLSIGAADQSRIYKTVDGGNTWSLQFANREPQAFYDALAFWDSEHGVAVGDPVDGHFTVIRTVDGGRSWTEIPAAGMPPALPGEGAFAASGTCLTVQGDAHAWFGTGGAAQSRIFRSADGGLNWEVSVAPIGAGAASAGVFSLAFFDSLYGVAVGGDYRKEQEPSENLARTNDGGRTWTRIGTTRLRGFRSAVAYLPGGAGRALVAVGPQGSDLSVDGGVTWRSLSDPGFHAFGIAAPKDAAWAVGENGRIAKLVGSGRGQDR